MKVTCKKTGKDMTSKVIKMLEKSITKGKYTIIISNCKLRKSEQYM